MREREKERRKEGIIKTKTKITIIKPFNRLMTILERHQLNAPKTPSDRIIIIRPRQLHIR